VTGTEYATYVDGWQDQSGNGHDLLFPDWKQTLCGKPVETGGYMGYVELTCTNCRADVAANGGVL